jgi:hypothetical protein
MSLPAAAGADGDYLAFLRLLLGGIGDDDASLGLLFGFDATHDHAVMQGTKLRFGHGLPRRRLRRVDLTESVGLTSP